MTTPEPLDPSVALDQHIEHHEPRLTKEEAAIRAYERLFDVVGAPYTPVKCAKCGHVGYPGHNCEMRQRLQAAERLARLVLKSAVTVQSLEYGGVDRVLVEFADAMLAEARLVLGEK